MQHPSIRHTGEYELLEAPVLYKTNIFDCIGAAFISKTVHRFAYNTSGWEPHIKAYTVFRGIKTKENLKKSRW